MVNMMNNDNNKKIKKIIGDYKYGFKTETDDIFNTGKGLSLEVVEAISKFKNEPDWMLEFRKKAYKKFVEMPQPDFGPNLDFIDFDDYTYYIKSSKKVEKDWNDVPEKIKDTFDKLGIPEAEKKYLAGVSTQFESEVVYHNTLKELESLGVLFCDTDTAVRLYPDLVKEYFGKVVPYSDNKYAALNSAVWSGGSFIYVPKGVKLDKPLQSYFRINSEQMGQFERTLIIVDEGASLHFIEGCSAPKYNVTNLHAGCVELFVKEGARLRYSTIENWSRNMMNLNTKRAIVEKDGIIEWVSGSFGSHISMLYPCSILHGENARCEFTGVTFASKGQELDTGASIIHAAPHTSANVSTRTISKAGGKATYRSAVKVTRNAPFAKCSVNCESLMLDDISRSDTLPAMDIEGDEADIGHEATIGRISDEAIFYLMCRGISEDEARAMIVRGFVEPIAKELPLEYAVEMNNLVNIELEGTIG